MSNNRMFLVHTPTGLAAKLGNMTGYGWGIPGHAESLGSSIELLFVQLMIEGYPGGQDAFEIFLEDESGTASKRSFTYGDSRADGLYNLILSEEKL